MAYIKLTDSQYGEIGHNGYGFVVARPVSAEDAALATGSWHGNATESVGEHGWWGLELGHEHNFALVALSAELLDAGRANRADFDLRHCLQSFRGGINQVRGGAYDTKTY